MAAVPSAASALDMDASSVDNGDADAECTAGDLIDGSTISPSVSAGSRGDCIHPPGGPAIDQWNSVVNGACIQPPGGLFVVDTGSGGDISLPVDCQTCARPLPEGRKALPSLPDGPVSGSDRTQPALGGDGPQPPGGPPIDWWVATVQHSVTAAVAASNEAIRADSLPIVLAVRDSGGHAALALPIHSPIAHMVDSGGQRVTPAVSNYQAPVAPLHHPTSYTGGEWKGQGRSRAARSSGAARSPCARSPPDSPCGSRLADDRDVCDYKRSGPRRAPRSGNSRCVGAYSSTLRVDPRCRAADACSFNRTRAGH